MELKDKEIDLSSLCALEQFCSFFEDGQIETMARQSGFICRSSSRLSGEAFLKMMVQNVLPGTEWSLNDQCAYLQEHFDIQLTKQSLDQRYQTFAVAFLKACYQAVLQKSLQTDIQSLSSAFSGIYLSDSTAFQLPAHLATFYTGSGGAGTDASIKIHQTLELLQFSICDLLITDGKANDQNYWKAKGFEPKPGSLWLGDLGYFCQDTFKQIAARQGYFLCRYKTGTSLYLKDEQGNYCPWNIEQYLSEADVAPGPKSVTIYFGQQKLEGRLICEKVPDAVKAQRLEKYNRTHAMQGKKGRQWSKTALKALLCGYNLYLTNAPRENLKVEDAALIYGLRWQIELVFKMWKSLLFLDKVGQMSIFRFECLLYGRLLYILLSTELMSVIKAALRDEETGLDIEISEWKTMKLIKKNFASSSVRPGRERSHGYIRCAY